MIKPKAQGEEFNVCICQTCPDAFEAPPKEFMEHCRQKHGVEKGESGSKQAVMHLDGAKFFEWRYQCEFSGKVKFLQCIRQARRGEDAAMWR